MFKINETELNRTKHNKGESDMRKKMIAAMLTGVMCIGLMPGNVMAASDSDELKGDVYAFIAASLSNSMEEIQKDFEKLHPEQRILHLQERMYR